MKKRIAIFTTNRAEFGLFSALLRESSKSEEIEILLFVGGSHLTRESGLTIKEIYTTSFHITDTFDYLLNVDSDTILAKSLGYATIEIANIFKRYTFDFVCILGDRFELLSIVSNAIMHKKPIIHVHGGEITEGAIDDQIRHMITKASHLHFAACQEYAQNIINMGEEPWRVYNTGALAVDNILHIEKISKDELFQSLKLKNKDTVLLTYHPVTLESKILPTIQIRNLFEALEKFDVQVVITAPNCDKDRDEILAIIEEKVKNNSDYHFFDSLGMKTYLNFIPHSLFVIGNSSSAIIEVPYFKIPTVNVGDRQRGRIMHESIISTDYSLESIISGIQKATDPVFRNKIQNMKYKFGNGDAAKEMLSVVNQTKLDDKLMRKKLVFNHE